MKPASDQPLPSVLTRIAPTQVGKQRVGTRVRVLQDPATGEEFTFHKDHFETGGFSQVYGGRDGAGRERVFKRLSLLQPKASEASQRLALREAGYHAGESHVLAVTREILLLRDASPRLAQELRILTTRRERTLSKIYLVMEPMRDDFLGCIRGLETQGEATRQGVAWELAAQLIEQLEHMHGRGIAHRDVKSENVLLTQDAAGKPQILLGDFGRAQRVLGACDAKREDATRLGVMCLQTLMPHRRCTAYAEDRDGARQECAAKHAAFAPLVSALLAGDLASAKAGLSSAFNAHAQAQGRAFLTTRETKLTEMRESNARIDRERAPLT